MNIQRALARAIEGQHLAAHEMSAVMHQVMSGACTPAQIGGWLIAMRMKGETAEELAGAAQVMRELSTKVPVRSPVVVDTCGTGGDDAGLFNVSTASALVVAAAGGKVAKHGNRSVTSTSGGADLLEAAGVRIDLSATQVARCIDEVGIGFMFAVSHHQAMKHAIGPRRELGVRTLFNLLGPVTNPAGARRQVLGVFSDHWLRPLAEVLRDLGSEHVLVVHAEDGLDEFSLAAPSRVAELRDGEIREYRLTPEDVGLESASLEGLQVNSPQESLALIREAFAGDAPKAADLIALNAGAALHVLGMADSIREGVARADDVLCSGLAGEKLNELIAFTDCLE
ncbi:MAG: anthranilate phosphoribosyltransferase [Pseudomonadota bacterium]|nr:anthranilate phosphoribosyltransferase [Pseudomonadota bacterium]